MFIVLLVKEAIAVLIVVEPRIEHRDWDSNIIKRLIREYKEKNKNDN